MKLTIDSMLRLQDVPAGLLEQIQAELTIKNPQYEVMKRIRPNQRWMWGEPIIRLWSSKTINRSTAYILPRGYYARLWELLYENKAIVDICDNRLLLPQVEYPKRPELRDYQTPAVPLAMEWQQGVVNSPAGSGKTVIGHAIIANLKQPALWVTHRTDLLQQSMERARTFLKLDDSQMGVIQEDRYNIGSHITFASVQTLCNRDIEEIKNKFGCIIVDECHRAFEDRFDKKKKRMFDSVISEMPAFYRFGLTATVGRSDGLIDTMLNIMGPVFYKIEKNDPRLLTMKPAVEFVESNYFYSPDDGEMMNPQAMYTDMAVDNNRNALLFGVLEGKVKDGDCCICLSHRISHLETLHNFVVKLGRGSVFIDQNTKMEKREKIFNDVRNGKYQYMFATYALVKEGLDIPRLNKLVEAMPVADKVTVEQAVGRTQRPEEGKRQPVVYDIYDSRVPQLRNWARERVKVYKTLGATVEGGPKVRK